MIIDGKDTLTRLRDAVRAIDAYKLAGDYRTSGPTVVELTALEASDPEYAVLIDYIARFGHPFGVSVSVALVEDYRTVRDR